jgi:coenzyme Q-binding protein COQ10
MPQHKETRALPFEPSQLFDLVADIERYPEFLPWCKGARILSRADDVVTADLIIGYKMLHEKFTSRVTLNRPKRIEVEYLSGPLAHLKNEWAFEAAGRGWCNLTFQVEFDFRSSLLGGVMEMFFDKAMRKMASAFEERARELYGKAE